MVRYRREQFRGMLTSIKKCIDVTGYILHDFSGFAGICEYRDKWEAFLDEYVDGS